MCYNEGNTNEQSKKSSWAVFLCKKIGGSMKEYLVPFTGVFEIERRLREIDDNYRLYFNKKDKRFEVHNLKNVGDTLSVVCPFDTIDARLIRLVRQTRAERSNLLFKEIEEHNEKILEKNKTVEQEAKSNAKARLEELKNRLKA